MPNLTPGIRIEVYIPIRYHFAYRRSLDWVIDEFSELRGGRTVHEDLGGYYLSRAGKVVDDRVSVVYSDFPLDWNKGLDRAEVSEYCVSLKQFLLENLWEEEILITAFAVTHVADTPRVHNS